MALHKIRDFDPNYREHFEDQDVIGYDLYAGADKVGSVDDKGTETHCPKNRI